MAGGLLPKQWLNTSRGWRKPAHNPIIDWSHPMTQQLHRCYITPPALMKESTVDIVSGAIRNAGYISSATHAMDPVLGACGRLVNTSSAIKLPSVNDSLPIGTIVCLHRNSTVTGGSRLLFVHLDYTSGNRIYFGFNANSLTLRLGASAGPSTFGVPARSIGDLEFISTTWSGTTGKAYNKGLLLSGTHTFSGTPGSNADLTMYGYDAGGGLSAAGYVPVTYLWKRELNVDELRSLYFNPYQFLV